MPLFYMITAQADSLACSVRGGQAFFTDQLLARPPGLTFRGHRRQRGTKYLLRTVLTEVVACHLSLEMDH